LSLEELTSAEVLLAPEDLLAASFVFLGGGCGAAVDLSVPGFSPAFFFRERSMTRSIREGGSARRDATLLVVIGTYVNNPYSARMTCGDTPTLRVFLRFTENDRVAGESCLNGQISPWLRESRLKEGVV